MWLVTLKAISGGNRCIGQRFPVFPHPHPRIECFKGVAAYLNISCQLETQTFDGTGQLMEFCRCRQCHSKTNACLLELLRKLVSWTPSYEMFQAWGLQGIAQSQKKKEEEAIWAQHTKDESIRRQTGSGLISMQNGNGWGKKQTVNFYIAFKRIHFVQLL